MCPVALEQGRFTYRRNCVLAYLVRTLKTLATLNEVKVALYADLPGMGINGGTVPANILPTSERPDIVMHFPSVRKVVLMELTVPFEPNIEKARVRKNRTIHPVTK